MASASSRHNTNSTMEGWIKLHRILLEWEWHDVPAMMTLWVHLLMLANNHDREWHGTKIVRGQLATSLSNLSAMTGLTVKQVRLCLQRLKDSKQICTKRANKFTIITICKFESYQLLEQVEGQTKGTERADKGQEEGTERADKGQQREKERKKEGKNNIKTSTNVDAKRPSFVDPAFETVFSTWLEYKHQRRESYKSEMSLRTCYKKLYDLAGGDPAVAMAIVEQSMANNWAGLFALKRQNNGTNQTQPTGDPRQQERANLARDYAATISRRLAEDDARTEALRKP